MGWFNWNGMLVSYKTLFVFICTPGIHIFFCLWICVCSSISIRVAFSREIWRAIYRSLPEHQAWCCCCCSYLSRLLTTPASVSLCLSIFIFSLFCPALLCFRSPLSLDVFSLAVFQSSVFISFLQCMLWCKLLISAEGRRLVAWP